MVEVIGGRYELGDLIGRGGMARVVRGRDLRLDRDVAIKLVSIDAADGVDPAGRERFVREARSSARFHHPHAVAVFDAGQDDRYLYLVMELVEGPPLSAVLADRGPLEVADSVRIASEVLEALGAAHQAGIVHRDVKPGNVLLTAGGDAKLADFGIAKRLDEVSGDLTSTGQFIGTPKYLAPEQVMGQPVTGAADLYATGVVLFEMLAGEAPFDSATPVATAIAHRDEPVPDLRALRPDAPDHVVDAVTRAMAKDPIERFASADDMRAALLDAPTVVGAPPALAAVAPAVTAPTMMMPSTQAAPVEPTGYLPLGRSDRARRVWWLALFVLAAIAAGALAIAVGGDDSGDDDRLGPNTAPQTAASAVATQPVTNAPQTQPVATPAPTVAPTEPPPTEPPPTEPPPTEPPPTEPPPTEPPPTEPPPTEPPPTEPPPTEPPPTEPPPPPSDLEGLLGLLGSGEMFGASGPELAGRVAEVLDRNGRDQAEEAEQLRDDIDEWVDDDELDEATAELARQILEPIATRGNSGNGGGNGDGGGGGGDGDGGGD